MGGQGARLRRFMKRNGTVGPEMAIVFVSLDRRHETLECGHVLTDMPHHPTSPHPVKARRCPHHQECPARSIVDGWRCCRDEGHADDHETAGGYKFKASR